MSCICRDIWSAPIAKMKSSPRLLWALSVLHLGLCLTFQVSGGSYRAASICSVVNSRPQTKRGLCAYAGLFNVTLISRHLPVLCYTYGCSFQTNISLTESACANLIRLYETMWQDSPWNPLPQYCCFTYLKILWQPLMIWKITSTFSSK